MPLALHIPAGSSQPKPPCLAPLPAPPPPPPARRSWCGRRSRRASTSALPTQVGGPWRQGRLLLRRIHRRHGVLQPRVACSLGLSIHCLLVLLPSQTYSAGAARNLSPALANLTPRLLPTPSRHVRDALCLRARLGPRPAPGAGPPRDRLHRRRRRVRAHGAAPRAGAAPPRPGAGQRPGQPAQRAARGDAAARGGG